MSTPVLFWDEDTQRDFILPSGKLVVPGAMEILTNLGNLTEFARKEKIPILGSVDAHRETDPEISMQPDYRTTFPPHCMEGTPGQLKVTETAPQNPLWIENRPEDAAALKERILKHDGEILLKKNTLDVFSNPNMDAVWDTLQPERVVVYGVATDFCVACLVEGLLGRGDSRIYVVEDAIKAINTERGEQLKRRWKERGVRLLQTEEVLARAW